MGVTLHNSTKDRKQTNYTDKPSDFFPSPLSIHNDMPPTKLSFGCSPAMMVESFLPIVPVKKGLGPERNRNNLQNRCIRTMTKSRLVMSAGA